MSTRGSQTSPGSPTARPDGLGEVDEAFLDIITAIVLEAGRTVQAVHASIAPEDAEIKGDGSPVTRADREAEAIILKGLREIAPHTPVVAEEEAAAGRLPEIGAEFFLVDPLDGTKEFLKGAKGGGEFTVNVGLVRAGAPVAGVVYAPALGKLWGGGPKGAWSATVRDGFGVSDREPIAVRPPPAGGLAAVASRSHRSPETDAFLARYEVAEIRSAGSSMKFCVVAAGEADIYPRLGRTMEWDTAAGDAVLRAAGGRTLTLDGAPLSYGKTESDDAPFANPHFVALGGAELRAEPAEEPAAEPGGPEQATSGNES